MTVLSEEVTALLGYLDLLLPNSKGHCLHHLCCNANLSCALREITLLLLVATHTSYTGKYIKKTLASNQILNVFTS